MEEEQIEKAVLAYLKRKGFKQTELALQEEQRSKNSSVTLKTDPDVAKHILSFSTEASSMEEIKEQRNDEDDGIEHTEDHDILEIVSTIEGGRRKAEGSLLVPGEQPCTIFRVHKVFRQVNKERYEPQLVSIGPYHRNKEGLKPMEEKKFEYLLALLSRNPELKLEVFVKEIKKLETKARKCYSESIGLQSKEFVEMMVIDGCFLVEIFLRTRDTTFNDELWLPYFISGDMLLLENQLPFFVLESICSLVVPIKKADLLEHILELFRLFYVLPLNTKATKKESYHHVLDIIHHHCLPKPLESSSGNEGKVFSIPSAEELEDAGIEFQRKETGPTGSFLDIEFDKKGVLKIPFLYFHSDLQTIFQNLIAYERCCYPEAGIFFIGYGLFMDDLINTAKDVRILSHARIFDNTLGSEDLVAQYFNDLATKVFAEDDADHLYRERVAINDYCGKKWPSWRAKLKRDYFSSRWGLLSLIAAVMLLLLTITQTVFAIMPSV